MNKFLVQFRELTEIVSDSTNSLAIIVLLKAQMHIHCSPDSTDTNELKELKKKINSNIDRGFQTSETTKLAAALNPRT